MKYFKVKNTITKIDRRIDEVVILASILEKFAGLEVFSYHTIVSYMPRSYSKIFQDLQKHNNLKKISFKFATTFSEQFFNALSQAFDQFINVKSVNHPEDFRKFAKSLKKLTTLRTINMEINTSKQMEGFYLEEFSKSLGNLISLEKIVLHTFRSYGFVGLYNGIGKLAKLKSLNLIYDYQYNYYQNAESFKSFGQALSKLKFLTSLNLFLVKGLYLDDDKVMIIYKAIECEKSGRSENYTPISKQFDSKIF